MVSTEWHPLKLDRGTDNPEAFLMSRRSTTMQDKITGTTRYFVISMLHTHILTERITSLFTTSLFIHFEHKVNILKLKAAEPLCLRSFWIEVWLMSASEFKLTTKQEKVMYTHTQIIRRKAHATKTSCITMLCYYCWKQYLVSLTQFICIHSIILIKSNKVKRNLGTNLAYSI
jgi:hypothetical protein